MIGGLAAGLVVGGSLTCSALGDRPPVTQVDGLDPAFLRADAYGGDGSNTNGLHTARSTGTARPIARPAPAWAARAGDRNAPAVVADFDGNGTTEISVFRSGAWLSPSGEIAHLGLDEHATVPADYDGDGAVEPAVWDPATGAWFVEGVGEPTYFGLSSDVPVPGDFDGDGDVERAVWRPETGAWFVEGVGEPTYFGLLTDIPVLGDYTGTGRAAIATYRPATGAWLRPDEEPVYFGGQPGDRPLPLAWSAWRHLSRDREVGPGDRCGTITERVVWSKGVHTITCPVVVAEGARLILEPGVEVVSELGGTAIEVAGELVARGAEDLPVTLTVPLDTREGGSTQRRTTAALAPAAAIVVHAAARLAGRYLLIKSREVAIEALEAAPSVGPAVVDLTHATLEATATCLEVGSGTLGRLAHSRVQGCLVVVAAITFYSAVDVVWGEEGLAPGDGSDSRPRRSGPVATYPAGGVEPEALPASLTAQPPAADAPACSDLLFVGLRGSGQPPEWDPEAARDDSRAVNYRRLGEQVADIQQSFAWSVEDLADDVTTDYIGLHYPAKPVPLLDGNIFNVDVPGFFESAWFGATALMATLEAQQSDCPEQRFVISGYSQGAWAAHLALALGEASQAFDTSRVAAVGLLADPMRSPGHEQHRFGTASRSSVGAIGLAQVVRDGTGEGQMVDNLSGFSDYLSGASAARYRAWGEKASSIDKRLLSQLVALGEDLDDRTVSVCNDGDPVCALPGTDIGVHSSYSPVTLADMGRWLAHRALELPVPDISVKTWASDYDLYAEGVLAQHNYDYWRLTRDHTLNDDVFGYTVRRGIVIPEGVTLTVPAGVALKMGHCYWTVHLPPGPCISLDGGRLVLEGTESEPVIVTSLSDDRVGGDVDGDNSLQGSTNIHVGRGSLDASWVTWRGYVGVSGGGEGSEVSLRHGQFQGVPLKGSFESLHVDGIRFRQGGHVDLAGGGPTLIERSVFAPSATLALNGPITLRDSEVQGAGVTVHSPDVRLVRNAFASAGIEVHTNPRAASAEMTGNTVDGAPRLRVEVSGGVLTEDTRWHADATYVVGQTVTVQPGATLTLEPGAIVKFQRLHDITFERQALQVNGSLVALGLPSAPIHLVARNDGRVGGDTSLDGDQAYIGANWRGLGPIPSGASVRLSHVVMRDAGTPFGVEGDAVIDLDHVRIEGGDSYVGGDHIEITNSVIGSSALGGALRILSGQAKVSDTRFQDAQLVNSSAEARLSGISFAGESAGMEVSPDGAGATLSNITGDAGPIAARVRAGQLTADRTWSGEMTWLVDGTVVVPSETALTLAAGATLKLQRFRSYQGEPDALRVDGELRAAGTSAAPVTLLPRNDGSAGAPAALVGQESWAGDSWKGIATGPTAAVKLEHAVLRGAALPLRLEADNVGILSSTSIAGGGLSTSSEHVTVTGLEVAAGPGGENASLQVTAGDPAVAGLTLVNATLENHSPHADFDGVRLVGDQARITLSPDGAGALFADVTRGEGPAYASVNAGSLTGSRTWTKELTLRLDGAVFVPQEHRLTVPAGSVIKGRLLRRGYGSPDVSLTVAGSLDLAGTSVDPVHLTNANDSTVGADASLAEPQAYEGDNWSGVQSVGGVIEVAHTTISGAPRSLLLADGAPGSIESSSFDGLVEVRGQSVVGSVFTSMGGYAGGLQLYGASASVTRSILDGVPLTVHDGGASIRGNQLIGEASPKLVNVSADSADANGNWWGRSSGPVMSGGNAEISGNVRVDDWCSSPACA